MENLPINGFIAGVAECYEREVVTVTDETLEKELVYLHYQECLGQIANVFLGL